MVLTVNRTAKFSVIFLLCALVSVFVLPTSLESAPTLYFVPFRQDSSWDSQGPFVDRMIFEVITGPDVQVAALIAGDIDFIADTVEPSYFEELSANPNIVATQTERLGFGFMAINCQRYPYNIPALRRAIAYAIDKHTVATSMWEERGFALDNPILASCGAWHNSHTTPNFRDTNVAAAQAELALAGFVDLDGDGFVEAPNGDSFTFQPMYTYFLPQWEKAINAIAGYLEQAGIRTDPRGVTSSHMFGTVYTIPRNYDAACYAFHIRPNPLILQNFITSEIQNPNGNMLNWANQTFDDWIEVMMTASDFTDVLEAAHQAQQVFVENTPMIVMYSNWENYAYRTDKYEGWVEIPGWSIGPMNYWNPVKVRLKEGQPERDTQTGTGGTLRTTISSAMDSQNPLTSTSVYGNYPLSQVYSRLTGLNDVNHLPTKQNGGLAYYWTVEPHPNGLKYIFTLYDNATWHDLSGSAGGLVTAYDVEFSYNYMDNNIPTYSRFIPYLNSCTAIDDTTVEIVTNGDSYWAFDNIRDWVILPEHVWSGIVTPVTFTNPRPIGCGPFKWKRRVEGVFVDLHYWENYHRGFHHREPIIQEDGRPLYPVIGVSVIIGTLIASGIYLNAGQRKSRESGRSSPQIERRLRGSGMRTLDVHCPNCRTRAAESDRFCAECGYKIR